MYLFLEVHEKINVPSGSLGNRAIQQSSSLTAEQVFDPFKCCFFQRGGWRCLLHSANKNNAPEEPQVLKKEMLKGINKLSSVHHWARW